MRRSFREDSPVMLAWNKDWSYADLVGDYAIQNKIDGFRCWGKRDGDVTLLATRRPFKYIKNRHTCEKFKHIAYAGIDGELVIPGYSFHDTSGILRSHNDQRGADAVWMMFDCINETATDSSWAFRHQILARKQCLLDVHLMAAPLYTPDRPELYLPCLEEEMEKYRLPFEGYILRQFDGRYKFGRATRKEATLFKLVTDTRAVAKFKRFIQRVSQDHYGALQEVGAIVCDYNGSEIKIGSGFSRSRAAYWWEKRDEFITGTEIHFTFKAEGTLDLPRQPIYAGGLP